MKITTSVMLVFAFIMTAMVAAQPAMALQGPKVSEEEAHAIGVRAYIYFFIR